MYFPSATYRIQLNSGYTLDQLKTIIPYLHKLGISTIYGAPSYYINNGQHAWI